MPESTSKTSAAELYGPTGSSASPPITYSVFTPKPSIRSMNSWSSDSSWTWRAAGARQPKGTVEAALVPAGEAVGAVLKLLVAGGWLAGAADEPNATPGPETPMPTIRLGPTIRRL